ncbi:MAG: hypothetical protein RLZZ365_995 [Pseudomonadota bacterium]|jgi:uncharacterized membrane protein
MDITLARALHILSIVIWIGGVSFVTVVLIPLLRTNKDMDSLTLFNQIENRFAYIARAVVLIAGISGFYMVYQLNAWDRFFDLTFFWMHAMLILWLMFMVALFIVEPFFLKDHGRMVKQKHNISNLRKTQIVHWILLSLSLVVVVISVLGAHGFFY